MPSARAPEPGTFMFMFGGVVSIIVRFVRKSFNRLKRMLDLTLSVVALTLCLPILAFVALLIKLTSPGPIVYTQRRVGLNGNVFRIYKLRTMRTDAEKNSGAVWARKKDPRITPIGRILRKSHFDEILQFFNVLKGDMSIVGPRPERPEIVRELVAKIKNYDQRHSVKPGITGLSQVSWSYDVTLEDVKRKVKYDLLYIKKMCLLVDLRIMARTFLVMTTGRGAH
jgi:lipopolysaccharide/colanic/teichoic acid biosynthesis glycosyltransferase